MEGGDNDFAEVLVVLAGLDKCEELGYEHVELGSDSQIACGVLSGSETINMDDMNRMECMLLRFKSTKFKRLVSVQKPREIKDWSLCEILFMVDDILREKVHSSYFLPNLLKKWSPYLRGQSIYSITRTKLTRDIILPNTPCDTLYNTRYNTPKLYTPISKHEVPSKQLCTNRLILGAKTSEKIIDATKIHIRSDQPTRQTGAREEQPAALGKEAAPGADDIGAGDGRWTATTQHGTGDGRCSREDGAGGGRLPREDDASDGRCRRRTAPASGRRPRENDAGDGLHLRAVDADDERHPGICSASEEEAPETSGANVEESGDKCKQPHKEKKIGS
uniref:Uncharacterized protein n=1 Tax=Oryza meridionalis TaxID=40149 RepID=A0A0E0DMI1_9ORYZ